MIKIGQTLIHDDIINESFVCHLDKCKGACCVKGDAGAPLEQKELAILEEIYPLVKPYMTAAGIATVESSGTYVKDSDGNLTTPCVDTNKECAYVIFENGITKCAIEKAYENKDIHWKKPMSCHLYPIRIVHYPDVEILEYDRWNICASACNFGKELKVRIYQFLKEPLIRKYGIEWCADLEKQVESNSPTN